MMIEARIKPNTATRAGRMIEAGQIHITVKSLVSGYHLTLRFFCSRKIDGSWQQQPFSKASHVFVREGDIKVATLYPETGKAYVSTGDKRLLFAFAQAAMFLNGEAGHPKAETREESLCGRCGRELTDPISIERGIGPTCYGKETGSEHLQIKTA